MTVHASHAPAPGGLPVFEGPPVPERVSLQAVEWLVALQSPAADATTRQAFENWRTEHADHDRAWRHIESCGAQLRGLNAPLTHGALVRDPTGTRGQRRRAIKLLAVAAFTGSGAWLAHDEIERLWQDARATHRTATGERRHMRLADASQVELDSSTAIHVRFDATQRRIDLLHGRILVTTSPDPDVGAAKPARPFHVETAEGRLQALGTRFAVRRQPSGSHVAVFEGAVEIRPTDAPHAARVVRAGEQAAFDRSAVEPPHAVDAQATAWTRGMLVAHDMPMADFLAELARYRTGRLACDPAVAGLKVSGVYPLDDTDRVLDMLLRTQPVEARYLTRYWITVQPRGD